MFLSRARKDHPTSSKHKEEPNVFDHGFDKYEYKGYISQSFHFHI